MDPIVIVGGGIVGVDLAYRLRDHPRPVVLYERDALGSGTTADSVAIFVRHQSSPDRLSHELRERAWDHYEPLVEDGTFDFERIGTLEVARTDRELAGIREAAETLSEFGVEASVLDPAELADHGLDPDAVAGAMWTPNDGYLDPAEIVQYHAGEAADAGVTIETGTAVTDVRVEDGSVVGVETADGTRPAAAVVNAAGPWAPTVNDTAGVSLPFRHNRGPVVVLGKDDPFSLPFVQFGDGLYVRGEGRNQAFGGSFGASYGDAGRLDPTDARSVGHDFYLEIGERIEAAIPRLEGAEVVTDWVGVRTLTPDGVPVVGETEVDDFYVAVGMNGLGVTLAPAVGEFLAKRIAGETVDPEIAAYLSPGRFA
ncbi:sarcosine oxidase subunit beta [Halorubrum aquaticum]|uniref:Sarcosine oxidase subunit beta n=1 Tax=Halorubrum aquaticum TaxID=387340 RepID=A0A1I3CBR0_9EURY|nr:FAD-dependent oxidoreductase [Halorubrum aquaticum]SFH71990.1 sarcosine oxidase subunit beta [Halorubrum aquaticum]